MLPLTTQYQPINLGQETRAIFSLPTTLSFKHSLLSPVQERAIDPQKPFCAKKQDSRSLFVSSYEFLANFLFRSKKKKHCHRQRVMSISYLFQQIPLNYFVYSWCRRKTQLRDKDGNLAIVSTQQSAQLLPTWEATSWKKLHVKKKKRFNVFFTVSQFWSLVWLCFQLDRRYLIRFQIERWSVCKIFLRESNVTSGHFRRVAILSTKQHHNPRITRAATQTGIKESNNKSEEVPVAVDITRRVALNAYIYCFVTQAPWAFNIHAIEPMIRKKGKQETVFAYDIMTKLLSTT